MAPDRSHRAASSPCETHVVLVDRYVLSWRALLGSGAFGEVYKGLDKVRNVNVAIKVFRTDDNDTPETFAKAISIMQSIAALSGSCKGCDIWDRQASHDNSVVRQSLTAGLTRNDAKAVLELVEQLDMSQSLVQLLDCSLDGSGQPGMDDESGLFFLILELGEESLRDRLDYYLDRQMHPGSMPADEFKDLLWSIVCTVWALHSLGFTHMDVKPENILLFHTKRSRGQWKLIDLDGAMCTGSRLPVGESISTPLYMAPELASVHECTVSRRMDVWSAGMVAMEVIFLRPVLAPFWEQWKRETGSSAKFYAWLADCEEDPIVSGDMESFITQIDADLCSLLKGMLSRHAEERFCMGKCLIHPFFHGHNNEELVGSQRVSKLSSCMADERKSLVAKSCTVM